MTLTKTDAEIEQLHAMLRSATSEEIRLAARKHPHLATLKVFADAIPTPAAFLAFAKRGEFPPVRLTAEQMQHLRGGRSEGVLHVVMRGCEAVAELGGSCPRCGAATGLAGCRSCGP